MNEAILSEIAGMDYAAEAARLSGDMAGAVERGGLKGAVFGMSGGIDSAVVAYLCSQSLRDKTLALVMPDTSVTPEAETADALRMISLTGIEHKLVDIRPIVDAYSMYVEPHEQARGNLRARVRASLLYYYANVRGYMVVGTSDKSEYEIGYFTKFGDGACDIAPISSLYKLQVRGLAAHLGVPENVVSKKSSPHLWPDHDAEGELGMTYEEMDSLLYCMIEKGMGPEEAAAAAGVDPAKASQVEQMRKASRHKRPAP